MEHPEYQDLKNTEIPWIKPIPQHWEVKKFRFLFSFGRGLGITKKDLKDDGVPCINYGEIHSKYGFEVIPGKHELKCVPEIYLESDPRSLLKEGDFVFADTSEDLEGSGNFSYLNSNIPTFAGYHTVIARLQTEDHPRYIAYLFDSLPYRHQIRISVSGVKVFSVTQEILKNSYILLPPKEEQGRIVEFLDNKTSKIDQLIEKKNVLIEKLNEQRIAIITQAVTKGLDKNVKMKSSSVDWLGDVPEHWEVKAVKRICMVSRGASPRPIQNPKYFDEEGQYAWVRIADVTANDHYLKRTTQRLSELGKSFSVPLEPGSLFLSIAGSVGKPMITEIKCCIHDGFVYFPYLRSNPEFLYYIFLGGQCYLGLGKLGTQLNLNTDTVGAIKIGVPPEKEQEEIIDFLNVEMKRIDLMVEKVNSAIALIMEYRSALITDTVTGKIDVRSIELA